MAVFFSTITLTAIAIVIVTTLTAVTARLIQSVVPNPYMDELFHVPQVQHYCDSNWTRWDPMITTLPGMYLASIVLLQPVATVLGSNLLDLCTIQNLRGCNQVFTAGNFLLLYLLTHHIHHNLSGKSSGMRKSLNAFVLTLLPVLYFFSWLYYTDPGSTFFNLLMYLLCLRQRHGLAALAGAGAILFRQTNVIWVFFCLALRAADILAEHVAKHNKGINRKLSDMKDIDAFKVIVKSIVSSPRSTFSLAVKLVCATFWYISVILAFAVFVYVNQGIVVGDKSHHTVSYNFPQIFYFLLVTGGFSFMYMVSPQQIINFFSAIFKNPIKVCLFVAVSVYLIKNFTYEHKYTLSDNRHYTFYVWSKVFKRHPLARYAMIPAYLYSLYQLYTLTASKGFLWRGIFSLCVVLVLVPQALLEFRYFIVPYYIIRLNMKLPSTMNLCVELVYYSLINAFTVYMFVYKPFYWPKEEAAQRFMW